MSSTASSPSGFLSSPRNQRRLMWISGAVLAIGIAVFLGVYLSRGTSQSGSVSPSIGTVSSPPSKTHQAKNPTVAPSTDALKVGRTFLETAVLRKNLDVAYPLVGPDLKGGMSLAQFKKGNLPIVPYPAVNAKTAPFKVTESHKTQLFAQVVLVARKGSGVKPLAFNVGLQRVGKKWIVNYWVPEPTIKVRASDGN
ncbi:MAG TPA: hypothetical protein VJ716_02355 [Gaiellaceae bacterium]|nr:hypothetical protein [Gaiellaceae bacterium]